MQRFLAAAVSVVTAAGAAIAAITPSQTARLAAAAGVVQSIHDSVPDEFWNRAQCVAVIPDLKDAALMAAGNYGRGVMSCRAGERWSAPTFMQFAGGSWGFKAGAEEMDVVLLVMSEQGVQKMLQDKIVLGADASVAAGPLGQQGHVGNDVAPTAEMLAYSRAGGRFVGIDLSGVVLRPDVDSNTEVYGSRATPRTILASRELSAPTQANAFLSALNARATMSAAGDRERRAQTPAPSPDTRPGTSVRTTTVPSTDDDLRTRVVDIQQILDRVLADTTPSPVGTSGNTPSPPSTVAVDRVRLMQMREQLDALLAALSRR